MLLRRWIIAVAVAAGLQAGCGMKVDRFDHSQLTAEQRKDVENGVRSFAGRVAQEVTQQGPIAWNEEFAEGAAFFMASDGKLAFPDRATAAKMMPQVAEAIPHIELQWGDDLRVDPLTKDLAMMASSWHEVQVLKDGRRVEERGFFTGLAERKNGQWQFRDAHWSSEAPPAKAP